MGKYHPASPDSFAHAFSASKCNLDIFSRTIFIPQHIADAGRVPAAEICISNSQSEQHLTGR
jgi:hypothetical protein